MGITRLLNEFLRTPCRAKTVTHRLASRSDGCLAVENVGASVHCLLYFLGEAPKADMNTPEFLPCTECGTRISIRAASCPKCGSAQPRGVRCKLCDQVFKASEATTWDKIDQHPVPTQDFRADVYHRACLQTIVPDSLPDSIPCKVCGATVKRSHVVRWPDLSGWYEPVPCPECGAPCPVEVERCERCTIPVFPAGHRCVLTQRRESCFPDYSYGCGKHCYHTACYGLYFKQYINDPQLGLFGYEGEYSRGHLVRESEGDSRAQQVLSLRCQRAKEQGQSDLFVEGLQGPFKSFWGNTIDDYGIARKSLTLRNLTGSDREIAEKVVGWGYSVFVSRYPFSLMISI